MSHNHDHDHNHNSNNNNLSALLAGAIIGAAAIYFFGTDKGKALKDELIDTAQKYLDKVGEEVEDTKIQIKENKEDLTEQLAERLENLENTTQALTQNLAEVPEHIAAVQKKGRKFFFKRQSSSAAES